MLANGSTMTMASMAQSGNTTEQDLCTRMASSAKMVAAQQAAMPAVSRYAGWYGDADDAARHEDAVDAANAEALIIARRRPPTGGRSDLGRPRVVSRLGLA